MSKRLTPEEWIKHVQGKSTLEMYDWEDVPLHSTLLLMEWYADYINSKNKKDYEVKRSK